MCAPYGDPEYVQIFDSLGNYIDSIPMPIPSIDPIPNLITNPCLTPVDVCITQAFYTGTYTLPPIPGGYTLVYQRCCRNSAIQTIPNQSGSVYVAHISNDRYATNSSPRFTNRPPLFICADSYFQFDNSATDPNGDSLSYSLVNALDYTNSSTCVNPSPGGQGSGCPTAAYPPPYNSVSYFAPYSATNPLNNPSSTGNLVIDPTTGLLSGIPNQTGFFVVAVAVSEFRNGVYIGQTIRDYQFNIVTCNIPAATIPFLPGTFNPSIGLGAYYLNCSSRTVNFNGASFTNPPPTNIPLVYHWDFGVTTSTSDTSNLEFPIFTYPDTGTYIVTVITNKLGGDTTCQATAKAYIKIYPVLEAHFTFQDHCQDTSYVFTDASFSTTSPLSSWYWNFGDNDTSTQRNPTHHYANGGNFVVSLTAGNSQGCTNTLKDTVKVKPKPVPNFSTSPLCTGDSITFQ